MTLGSNEIVYGDATLPDLLPTKSAAMGAMASGASGGALTRRTGRRSTTSTVQAVNSSADARVIAW